MDFSAIAFYVFAAVTALSALAVISVKNSVHAALSLVLSFFSTACLWILLQAEFLGLVLVLVYVGAVMVLFLFVVMMLDINTERLREGLRPFPAGRPDRRGRDAGIGDGAADRRAPGQSLDGFGDRSGAGRAP